MPLQTSLRPCDGATGQAVVHCSGALPLDVLSPAAQSGGAATEAGAIGGAMHPLQTFTAGVDATAAFQGIACAIEAPAPLRGALDELAERLGGWPISLSSEDRALYHASAIAACGLVATLLKLAGDLWSGHSRAGGAGDASPVAADPQHARQHRAAGVCRRR